MLMHEISDDSDETVQMGSLIRALAARTHKYGTDQYGNRAG